MKLGKCIKYGNVLFYQHQVIESLMGMGIEPHVRGKGGGGDVYETAGDGGVVGAGGLRRVLVSLFKKCNL